MVLKVTVKKFEDYKMEKQLCKPFYKQHLGKRICFSTFFKKNSNVFVLKSNWKNIPEQRETYILNSRKKEVVEKFKNKLKKKQRKL